MHVHAAQELIGEASPMGRKYFGTDGIRGTANSGAMTAETALRVGMAAGRVFSV